MKDKSAKGKVVAGTTVLLSLLLSLLPGSQVIADSESQQHESDAALSLPAEDEMTSSQENASADDTYLIDLNQEKPASSRLPQRARALRKEGDSGPVAKYKAGIPCVPLMLVDDPSTLIVCDREASIKAENRTVSLAHGKGIYMVGKRPVTVETSLATITLPGYSAAIIEQKENGLLRIAHLTGAASTVAVKPWKGTKAFSAASGEEICLAPDSVSPSDAACHDGVAREEVTAEADNGIKMVQNKFAPKTMLDKECLQCDSNSFFQVRRKVYQLRKTVDSQEASAPSELLSDVRDSMPLLLLDNGPAEDVKPITYTEPAMVALPLRSSESDSALFKFNSKSDIGFNHPSVTELRKGEALVLAEKSTFVKTPHSMLRIEPGTLALISVTDDVTKVRNLWENRRNGLCQIVDNTPFYVVAGDESLTSKDLRSIYLSASKDMIGRRLTHYTELPSGDVVHFAEVSLVSLAQSNDLLMQVMNSADPVDKSLNRKLNKSAAILVQISASHGLYELMQPPQWRRDSKSSSLPILY